MLEKAENAKKEWEIVSVDDLVPKEYLLRKIEKAIDFTELYAFVEDKYSKTKGRPSVDPVVLIKIMMLQHLYGIKCLRRTVEEIKVNMNNALLIQRIRPVTEGTLYWAWK